MLELKEGCMYVGIDETNHGRYPETFVAAISPFDQDTKIQESLPKFRKNHQNLEGRLCKRGYTFLQVDETDYARHNEKLTGIVIASLLYRDIPEYLDHLYVCIDGHVPVSKKRLTKQIVSEILGLPRQKVHVDNLEQGDSKTMLLNIADETAHWIFKTFTDEKKSESPRRRYLLK